MKTTLLIATHNKNKLQEIKEILQDIPFKIKSLIDIGFSEEIKETGGSFKENAKIKAVFVGKRTGLFTLAEDSGLEIDALDGRPGIYSARYEMGSDLDRINKILNELKDTPKEKRTARFMSVIALFNPQTKNILFFKGVSRGLITEKPLGDGGFGYDPIFFNLDLGKTNAQATSEEKNRVSHRASALKKVKQYLSSE